MEVMAKLRFTTPSLGNVRGERRNTMLRNREGRVIFLQSWWRAGLRYAAQALGRFQEEAEAIQVDPEIEGTTKIHQRFYTEKSFQEHEAFLAGDEIVAHFCLPPGLKLDEFTKLLELTGRYCGISPYGYKQDYGRYVVIEVRGAHGSHSQEVGKCDPGGPGGIAGNASARGVDVPEAPSTQR